MTQTDIINRRISNRFPYQDSFVLETEDFQGISDTSSIDMSRHGARLIARTSMPLGSIISIEVPSRKLQLMGEIRWVRPDQDNASFEVGISFHELFPTHGTKIFNMIEDIQVQSDNRFEGHVFSFELESDVSSFLTKYIEEIRPDPIDVAPISYRRLGTPTENSFSFFTPSRPLRSEGSTSSFRIDAPEKSVELPIRAIALTLLAVSMFGFRNTFSNHLMQWTSPKTKMISSLTIPNPITPNQNVEFSNFATGPIEKIQWSGLVDQLEVKITFRDDISPTQVEVSKITFDDHPRALIRVLDVGGISETKNVMVGHSLINQIRIASHAENNHQNLHIVMDMTNPNVAISSSNQIGKVLTLRFQYAIDPLQ